MGPPAAQSNCLFDDSYIQQSWAALLSLQCSVAWITKKWCSSERVKEGGAGRSGKRRGDEEKWLNEDRMTWLHHTSVILRVFLDRYLAWHRVWSGKFLIYFFLTIEPSYGKKSAPLKRRRKWDIQKIRYCTNLLLSFNVTHLFRRPACNWSCIPGICLIPDPTPGRPIPAGLTQRLYSTGWADRCMPKRCLTHALQTIKYFFLLLFFCASFSTSKTAAGTCTFTMTMTYRTCKGKETQTRTHVHNVSESRSSFSPQGMDIRELHSTTSWLYAPLHDIKFNACSPHLFPIQVADFSLSLSCCCYCMHRRHVNGGIRTFYYAC